MVADAEAGDGVVVGVGVVWMVVGDGVGEGSGGRVSCWNCWKAKMLIIDTSNRPMTIIAIRRRCLTFIVLSGGVSSGGCWKG